MTGEGAISADAEDGRGRVGLILTVTAIMTVSTLMQYSLSAVGPLIIDDLSLSSAVYGSFFTMYFVVCALGSLALGGPTERIGARWGMALVGVTASAGFVLVAVAPSLWVVFVGLCMSGVAGAMSNPATNLALIDNPDRGFLVGIKQSGVQVSAVLGGAIVAPLAHGFGWRNALVGCGVVAVLVIVPARRLRRTGAGASKPLQIPLAVGTVGGLALFAFLMGCGLATTIAYLPLYAIEEVGLSVRAGGYVLGLFGACAVVGRVLWGFLSQRWAWFGRTSRSLGVMAAGALCSTILIVLASGAAPALVYGGAIGMGLTGAAWNGLVMASVMDSAVAGTSGRMAGRVQAAFFGGLCISPLAFGLLVDRATSYIVAWLGTAIIYGAAILVTQTLVHSRRGRCR